MKVFLCKWPDGTGKVVVCRNRQELFWALDFESDPYSAKYKVLKGDIAFNFRIDSVDEDSDEHGRVVVNGYDHEDDFIAEELASEEGWRTLRHFFPYANTPVKSREARIICNQMGWNPYGERKEAVQ
jgi:hypothetical protein